MVREEIWKELKNYEGYYSISSFGNIKSLDRSIITKSGVVLLFRGKIKGQSVGRDNYKSVMLSKDGKNKRFFVHRLLAETFIINPENKCCVNHIDGNRLNNNLSNLEWVTLKENARHAYDSNLINHDSLQLRASMASKIRKSKTEQYNITGEFIQSYESQKEAALDNGINAGLISLCCSGKNKTAGGFIFKTVFQ